MMVRITNGTTVIEVSRGAFENIYKSQGFHETKIVPPVQNVVVQYTEDELFDAEMREKPLALWDKDDIRRFAAINEIDLVGASKASQVRARIKAFLDGAGETVEEYEVTDVEE